MPDKTSSNKIDFGEKVNADYYFVIHGTIPETGPMVSFRRVGRVKKYGRKLIKCPYCTTRITDTESDTKVELFAISTSSTVNCQFHLTCYNCKRDVGMNIIIPVS